MLSAMASTVDRLHSQSSTAEFLGLGGILVSHLQTSAAGTQIVGGEIESTFPQLSRHVSARIQSERISRLRSSRLRTRYGIAPVTSSTKEQFEQHKYYPQIQQTLALIDASTNHEETLPLRRGIQVERRSSNQLLLTTYIEQNSEKLMRFAQKYSQTPEDAQDIVQEAVLRAYEHLDSFETGTQFNSWLLRIVHNVGLNHIRQTHFTTVALPDREEEETGMYVSWNEHLFFPGVEQELFNGKNSTSLALDEALKQLDAEQRAVIRCIDFEESTYAQAAEDLEIPVGTVMSRLYRSRRRLRTLLSATSAAV